MSFWKRLKRLAQANTNAVLDKLESPEKELQLLEEDIERERKQAKKLLLNAVTEQKRLEKELTQEQEEAAKWEKKAIRAVELGNDSLAREALAKRAEHDELSALKQDEVDQQRQAIEQLKAAQQQLEHKAEAALRQRNLLLARMSNAKLQNELGRPEDLDNANTGMAEFARLEREIDRLEFESDLQLEMNKDLEGADFDRRLRELEKRQNQPAQGGDLNDALAALKAKMGK